MYDSNTPEIFAAVVAATFVMVAVVFFVYDIFVQKRNNNLIQKAAQTNAIGVLQVLSMLNQPA